MKITKYLNPNDVFEEGQEIFVGITMVWNSKTSKWEQKSRFVQMRGVPERKRKVVINDTKKAKIQEQKDVFQSLNKTELEEFEL